MMNLNFVQTAAQHLSWGSHVMNMAFATNINVKRSVKIFDFLGKA